MSPELFYILLHRPYSSINIISKTFSYNVICTLSYPACARCENNTCHTYYSLWKWSYPNQDLPATQICTLFMIYFPTIADIDFQISMTFFTFYLLPSQNLNNSQLEEIPCYLRDPVLIQRTHTEMFHNRKFVSFYPQLIVRSPFCFSPFSYNKILQEEFEGLLLFCPHESCLFIGELVLEHF